MSIGYIYKVFDLKLLYLYRLYNDLYRILKELKIPTHRISRMFPWSMQELLAPSRLFSTGNQFIIGAFEKSWLPSFSAKCRHSSRRGRVSCSCFQRKRKVAVVPADLAINIGKFYTGSSIYKFLADERRPKMRKSRNTSRRVASTWTLVRPRITGYFNRRTTDPIPSSRILFPVRRVHAETFLRPAPRVISCCFGGSILQEQFWWKQNILKRFGSMGEERPGMEEEARLLIPELVPGCLAENLLEENSQW